jgi:hypothetical protein
MKKYRMKTYFRQFGKNGKFTPECSAVVFKNAGDQPVRINDTWLLEPGDETPTISTGHPDVVDETEYTFAFVTGGGGTGPLLNVIYTQIRPIDAKSSADACENF